MNNLPMEILALWIVIGGFIGGIMQMMFAFFDDDLSFKTAFYYAMVFYEKNKDKLNSAGLTIVIVIMSLLLLPGYVLTFFIVCLDKVFHKLWEEYKYVFRKEQKQCEEKGEI